MMSGFQRTPRLKRRLLKWQIFFIAIGGVIGVGFFQGASRTVGIAGPGGALLATIIVGLVAMAVMEAICHMICIWPIPNAMVEFVQTFVDEDLGTAIGVLYWYTYCVTFSVLINAIGSLSDYWGDSYMRKSVVYIVAPLVLLAVNAAPVEFYGWVEFIGGIVKLALVVGIFFLMLLLNLGVNSEKIYIGTKFIDDSVQFNENVATNKFAAVATCFPLAIFAYIGVELLTTTAFEARDPREMRFPARNIGWFTLVLYGLTTGVFVSNVFWTDSNLPLFFNQALGVSTSQSSVHWKVSVINEEAHAAPLIVLLRLGYSFLPGFINGCLIYSALSCANTSLYVASRQLYGLTRTITVTSDSNFIRKFFGWLGRVEHRTQSPWPALFISVLVLYWLPFINRKNNYSSMVDVQTILSSAGSVSCILVWCSQCIAYLFFYNWREQHREQIASKIAFAAVLDDCNTGWLNVFQPYLTYLATFATIAIVVFFNTASMWHGDRLHVKALSAFGSPAVLLLVYLIKKFTRRDRIKFWNNLSVWYDFETQIQYLNDLIFPDDPDALSDQGSISGQEMKPPDTVVHEHRSLSDVSTNFGASNNENTNQPPAHQSQPSWAIGDLQLIPHNPEQLNSRTRNQLVNQASPPPEAQNGSVSLLQTRPEESGNVSENFAESPTDYSNPNGFGFNAKYYDGRSNLSPRDAVAYPQSLQPQTDVDILPRPDHGTAPTSNFNPAYGIPPARPFHSHSNLRPFTHPHPSSQSHSQSPTPSRSLPQLHSQPQPQPQPQNNSASLARFPLSGVDSGHNHEHNNGQHQSYSVPRRRHVEPGLTDTASTDRNAPGPSFRERAMNSIPTTYAAIAAATTTPATTSYSDATMAAVASGGRTTNINTESTTSQPPQRTISRRPVPNRNTLETNSTPSPAHRFASPTSDIQPWTPPLHSSPPQQTQPPQSLDSPTQHSQPPLPQSLRIGNRSREGSWGWGERATGMRKGSGGVPGRHEFG